MTTQKCAWCFNLFEGERRPLVQVEALRRALLIDMTTPFDPPICDLCVNKVLTRNDMDKPPVTSLGFPNLLIANKMRG